MKPVQKRLDEAVNIRYQMRKHGIDTDPGVAKLKEDMNTFVRHGVEQTGMDTLSIGPEIFWHFSNTETSHVHVMKPKPHDQPSH